MTVALIKRNAYCEARGNENKNNHFKLEFILFLSKKIPFIYTQCFFFNWDFSDNNFNLLDVEPFSRSGEMCCEDGAIKILQRRTKPIKDEKPRNC